MKLRPEQLAGQLRQGLSHLYLLTGDEPLLVEEARSAIFNAARQAGFSEHQRMEVDAGFHWDRLREEAGSLSLFAEQRLLDIRIPSGKPGRDGGEALQQLTKGLGPALMAVITMPRLDAATQKTKWFKALEKEGLHLAFWPVDAASLPGWISRRARSVGLQLDGQAARFLADQVQGNLLAASQEIEKLALACPAGPVSLEAVVQAVTDNARYSVFDLGEAIIAGEPTRVLRTLDGLRGEGVEAILVLWAVSREVRILAQAASSGDLGTALDKARVPRPRRSGYTQAVRRLSAARWGQLLMRCADLDRAVKGVHPGNPWIGLTRVALAAAGQRVATTF